MKASRPFSGRIASRVVRFLDGALVSVFVGEYVVLIARLAQEAIFSSVGITGVSAGCGISLAEAVGVPAAVFVIVSAIRADLNRPRPYEACDITPLFSRDSSGNRDGGKSFPSRHMASATAIAVAFAFAWPSPAIIAVQALLCLGVAFTRIIGGVHFPRDIIAAALLAATLSIIGFAVF